MKINLKTNGIVFLICIISIFSSDSLYSQDESDSQESTFSLKPKSVTKGKTYALVIGISKYQDDRTRKLQYADKDAIEFVKFLRSPNGGSIDSTNLTLLINEEATVSNIYTAKRLIEEKIQENDRFYFYFSGHGDVENSIYELGFLIAYDTPYGNYLNNAVRIEDINNMANTLSILKGAQIILITDACKAGKLAGSENKGKLLVGKQLTQVENNEVRIASCEPDQESWEHKNWGGGRGAFSYHLINGLNGAADAGKKNGIITLKEIQNYLQNTVPNDVEDKYEEEQDPVIDGKMRMKLSLVKTDIEIEENNDSGTLETVENGSRSMGNSNFNAMLKAYKYVTEAELSDLNLLHELLDYSALEIINWSKDYFYVSDDYFTLNETNPEKLRLAKLSFATQLHNIVQKSVNNYLTGDAHELKRRQFYNNLEESEYDKYVLMLEIAIKLLKSDSQLYHIIDVKRHYFGGLALRLKMVNSNNPDSLRNEALQLQNIAYELEPNAPYINNELGILYSTSDEEASINYYKQAIELAPRWSFPYSNLSNLYFKKNELVQAESYALKAMKLNDQVHIPYIALGKIYNANGNLLQAEEMFRKSIQYDEKQALSYYYLANVLSQRSEFQNAETNYQIAEDQAMDIPLSYLDNNDQEPFNPVGSYTNPQLQFPEIDDNPEDFFTTFLKAYEQYYHQNFDKAIPYFLNCVQLEPKDPIAYYFLGLSYYELNDLMGAEYQFEKAHYYFNNPLELNILINEYRIKYDSTHDSFYEKARKSYKHSTLISYLSYLYKTSKNDIDFIRIQKEGIRHGYVIFYYNLLDFYVKDKRFDEAKNLVQLFRWETNDIKLVKQYEVYDKIATITKNIEDQAKVLEHLNDMIHSNNFQNSNSDFTIDVEYIYDELYIESYYAIHHMEGLVTLGLEYFSKMKNIDQATPELQARIYQIAGDLYTENYQLEKAYQYYKKSKELSDYRYSVMKRFVQSADQQYHYTEVMNELEKLDSLGFLQIEQFPIYIEYTSRKGNYEQSENLLERYNTITMSRFDTLQLVQFQNAFFSKEFDRSEQLLTQMVVDKRLTASDASYWNARISILKGDIEQSYVHLDKAIEKGFDYGRVLKYDEFFNELRDDDRFQQMVNEINPKQLDSN